MTLIARLVAESDERYSSVISRAVEEALEALTPRGPLPRAAIAMLLRRSMRNGAWRLMSRDQRALLLAASWAPIKVYRSPSLLRLLREAWLFVELATTRGRAVFAALLHLLAWGPRVFWSTAGRGLGFLVSLGVQLLNNPLLQLGRLVSMLWRRS